LHDAGKQFGLQVSPGIWEQKELKGFRLDLKDSTRFAGRLNKRASLRGACGLAGLQNLRLGPGEDINLPFRSSGSFTAITNGESHFQNDPPAASEYQLLNFLRPESTPKRLTNYP
jgi:hypothetical protein